MLAIGNDELGGTVKKGQRVRRHYTMTYDEIQEGIVEHAKDEEGKETDLLGFITTEKGDAYLVSIKGQLLEGWKIVHEE